MRYIPILWSYGGEITDRLVKMLNIFLASKTGLVIALVGPLIVIPMPQAIKTLENLLSSNWIQLWALFVLGIMSARALHHSEEAHKKVEELHKHFQIRS